MNVNPNYSMSWLLSELDSGNLLKYLFFWGNTNRLGQEIGNSCFSQWFELPFIVDGITYPTAEHWMMAAKAELFHDLGVRDKIRLAVKPGAVKELGRQISNFDELTWNQHKYEIVIAGNFHKFSQHPAFSEYLERTGQRILVEASPVDFIWGIGMAQDHEFASQPQRWRGENLLGFALMEVRDMLRTTGWQVKG